jgi:hypothetical protein
MLEEGFSRSCQRDVPQNRARASLVARNRAALAALRNVLRTKILAASSPFYSVFLGFQIVLEILHSSPRPVLVLFPQHRTEPHRNASQVPKGETRNLDEQPGRRALRANRSSTAFRRHGILPQGRRGRGTEDAPNNASYALAAEAGLRRPEGAVPAC